MAKRKKRAQNNEAQRLKRVKAFRRLFGNQLYVYTWGTGESGYAGYVASLTEGLGQVTCRFINGGWQVTYRVTSKGAVTDITLYGGKNELIKLIKLMKELKLRLTIMGAGITND